MYTLLHNTQCSHDFCYDEYDQSLCFLRLSDRMHTRDSDGKTFRPQTKPASPKR